MDIYLIEEGLKFLVLGMTTVYLFLYLMVVVLKIEAKIVQKYFPPKKVQKAPVNITGKMEKESDDEVVAAITAAIIEHRKK